MSQVWNRHIVDPVVPVDDYLKQVNDHDYRKPAFLVREFFHEIFPLTRIAQCPLCRQETRVRIDMLSIKRWRSDKDTNGDFFKLARFEDFATSSRDHVTCVHYFAVDVFIAFNGQLPEKCVEELDVSREFGPEKPYVMGELVDRFHSLCAVIHAVPICRIRGARYLPTYTAFLVSYYAEERELWDIKGFVAATKEIPYSYLVSPRETGVDRNGNPFSEWWDLESYARRKRLLWLEPETRDLPLSSIDERPFPFKGLTGRDYPIHVSIPPLRGRR